MTRAGLPLSEITLAILAGGEGSRMGRPKGLLRIGGRAILEYLLDQFAWPGPTLLVTAPGREHPPGWERFGRECVDPVAGQGPLRGVLTALENTTTEGIAVVTVDMPGVGREQLEGLARGVRKGDAEIMYRVPSTAAREGFLVEPFPLLVRKTAADLIRSRLATGALSVFGLRSEPGFAVHDAPTTWGDAVWVNLNRPRDLESFEARM